MDKEPPGLHLEWGDVDLNAPQDLDARLHGITTRLVWRSGGWAREAIDIACALVVAGRDTPATVELCSLPRGTALADVQPLVRSMLVEQGLPLPPESPTEAERFAYLAKGFGLGTVSFRDFYGQFYSQLGPWDEQSAVERRVTLLLDAWEHEEDASRRLALVGEMRAAMRDDG